MAPLSSAINIIAEFRSKAGSEEALVDALRTLVSQTLNEEGCEQFELIRAIDDSRRLVILERFRDESAFQEHMEATYVKDFLNTQVPELVDHRSASKYRPII